MVTDDEKPAFGAALAERYDRALVPLLFEPYAGHLASRIRALTPRAVLELAAGTGALTRALARVLPPEVAITATDISPPMIERGRARLGGTSVTWRQADAMQLPFPDGAFDGVVCQFGVMFFPDKTASFNEAARVLEAGGRYVFTSWNDWRDMRGSPLTVAAEVVSDLLGCDFASLVNPGYHDEAEIRRNLAAAPFEEVVVDRVALPATASSARQAALATVQGSLMGAVIASRCPSRLDEMTAAVEEALRMKFGSGVVVGRTDALIVSAMKIAC